MFNKVIVILSAGEDMYIKLWNARLELIDTINLRTSSIFQNHPNRNHSAQSIDVFACQNLPNTGVESGNSKNSNQNNVLLLGTRNNEIVEIKITTTF